jgi:hypothetical protein
VDRTLSSPAGAKALDGEDKGALRRDLTGILTRALTQDAGAFGADIDYDTAAAAEALGQAAPAETAQILIDRTLAAALRQGLLPISDAADAMGFSKRLDALQPLLDDTRPVVRQFAAEAGQSLRALMSALKAALYGQRGAPAGHRA